MEKFKSDCPNCAKTMLVKQLKCDNCNLNIEGDVSLPRLAKLNPEEREFIEIFVLCSGSIKEVGKNLGISYPTVKSRLNRIRDKLKQMNVTNKRKQINVLELLENGNISAKDAVDLLKKTE